MNSIIQRHREVRPNDTRSEDELTLLYGDTYFDQLKNQPDFVRDYERLRAERDKPPIKTELRRGLSAGVAGLEATAYGAGALVAKTVGADSVSTFLATKALEKEQTAAENAPTTRFEDIKNPETAARFGLYSAGTVLPSLGQAAVSAGVGAVVGGSTAGPPGVAAGAVTGFFGKAAFRSLVRKAEKEGLKFTIEDLAKEEGLNLLKKEAGDLAKSVGSNVAIALNSTALSSGEIYNDLVQNQNVDPDVAVDTAWIGGLAAAWPDTILPHILIKRFFPGVSMEGKPSVPASGWASIYAYVLRLGKEAAVTIPAETVTEGFQELVGIASEKYADPTKRDTPLTKEDISRIVNASAVGGIGGAIAGAAAAFPNGQPVPRRTQTDEHGVEHYWPNISQDRKDQIRAAKAEVESGNPTPAATATVRTFNEEEKTFYQTTTAAEPTPPEPDLADLAQKTIQEREAAMAELEARMAAANTEVAANEAQTQQATQADEEKARAEARRVGLIQAALNRSPAATTPAERSAFPARGDVRILAPAEFIGWQQIPGRPSLPMFRLTSDLNENQKTGSTVLGPTLEQAGFRLPEIPPETPAAPTPPVPTEPTPPTPETPVTPEVTPQVTPTAETPKGGENVATENQVTTTSEVPAQQSQPVVQQGTDQTQTGVALGQSENSKVDDVLQMIDFDGGTTDATGIPFDDSIAGTLSENIDERKLILASRDTVAGPTNDNPKFTRRGLFVRDNETGDVLLLGVYPTTKGKVMVTDPEGGVRGLPIRGKNGFLTRRLKDKPGDPRYSPLASTRFKTPTKDLSQTFTKEEFAAIAEKSLETVGRTAQIGDAAFPSTEVAANQEQNPEREVFELFIDHVPKDGNRVAQNVTKARIAETVDAMSLDKEGTSAFRFLKQTVVRNLMKDQRFMDLTLEEKQRAIYETIVSGFFNLYQREIGRGVGTIAELSSALQASLETPSSAAPSLDEIREGNLGGGTLLFRSPQISEQYRASVPHLKESLSNLLFRAARAGAKVNVLQRDVSALANELTARSGGAFDNATNTITLVLSDISNPTTEEFRTALHEVVHFVSKSEPDSTQRMVHRAIERLTDAELGIEQEADPRIRFNNPANLDAPTLAEERTASALSQEGMAPAEATSLAARIFQWLRELYIRSGLLLQRLILGEDHVSPQLAVEYMRTRFSRALSPSIIDFFAGGQLDLADRVRFFSPTNGETRVDERFDWANERFVYPDLVPSTGAAALVNLDNVLFRQPLERLDREEISPDDNASLQVTKDIAAANDVNNALLEAFDAWNKGGLNTANITFDAFIENLALGEKPANVVKTIEDKLFTKQVTPVPNFNVRIRDLVSGDFRGIASLKAISWLNTITRKVSRQLLAAQRAVEKLVPKRDANAKRLQELYGKYRDAEFLFSETFKSVNDEIGFFKEDMTLGLDRAVKLAGFTQELARITALDNEPLSPQYVAVVDRLARTISKDRVGFTDMLARVAAMDLNWRELNVQQIRDTISLAAQSDPLLRSLVDGSKQSKALLAIVASFAKRNDEVMALLQLRASQDSQAAVAIGQMLDTALTDATDDFALTKRLLSQVPREGKLAGRLFERFTAVRRTLRRMDRQIERNKSYLAIAKAALPLIQKQRQSLDGNVGMQIGQVNLVDGAELFDPKTADQPDTEVIASPKWTYKLIAENAPTPDEVYSHLKRWKEWLANPTNSNGALANTMRAQITALEGEIADKRHIPIRYSATNHVIGSIGSQMSNNGTASGRDVARRANRYTALVAQFRNPANVEGVKYGEAVRGAMKALGIKDKEQFMDFFYDGALNFFGRHQEFLEQPNGFEKLLNAWRHTINANPIFGPLMNDAVWTALVRMYRRTASANQFTETENREMGNKVKSELNGLFRDAVGEPITTVPRTLSPFIEHLHHEMTLMGWRGSNVPTTEEVSKLAKSDPAALEKLLAPLFTEEVMRDFVGELATIEGRSPFSDRDGYLAPRENVVEAFNDSKGSFLGFASRLFELSDAPATMDLPEFIGDTFDTVRNYFLNVARIYEKRKASQEAGVPVVSHQIMDARLADNFPTRWLSYQRYFPADTRIMSHQMAFHAAFGRDAAAVYRSFDASNEELKTRVAQLEKLRADVRGATIGRSSEQIKKAVQSEAAKRGLNLALLESAERNLPHARRAKEKFQSWMTAQGGGLVDARAALEILHTITSLVIQGPRTALLNTLAMFDPIVRFGINRIGIGAVTQNWQSFAGEAFGTFAGLFGKQLQFNSDNVLRRVRGGRFDPDTQVTIRERISALMAEDLPGNRIERGIIRGSRILRELIGAGATRRGDGPGRYATLKPQSAFTQLADWMNSSIIDGCWWAFSDLMGRAVNYLNDPAHAAEASRPSFKFTPNMLGYRRHFFGFIDDARAFDQLNALIGNYSMNLENMARASSERRRADPNAPLFTDEQFRLLAQVAQNEITLDSSISSRPLSFFTNPILRFGSPLISWSVARTEQLRNAFREPSGEASWAAFRSGMKMFTAILPLGLAWAWLMDEYDEKLTGKKSNLRGFGQDNNFLALLEQTARVGTFGLMGDLANTVGNFASGGNDLRGISIDNRALFMNSTLNMMNAMATFIRQGTFTYATVGRQMAQALGGAGYMQYAQIFNNALSLNNAESRVTARINVNNYLRAAGRELGLEVRIGGATSQPSPIRPYVTEMVLAAYSNDSTRFEAALRKAVVVARREGKEDPEKYVAQSFRSYHPLRTIFRSPPTEQEYRSILGVLPNDGRGDVSQAVALFNHFLSQLGQKPFTGTETKATKSKFSLQDFQRAGLRALSPQPTF